MARPKSTPENITHEWDAKETNREASIEANRRGYDDRDVLVGLDFLDKGKLWVDPNLVPANKVYAWARERLLNEDRQDELDDLLRRGWDYVLRSDNPALADKRSMEYSRHRDDPRIRKYGMILMQMDKERYETIQNYYNKKSIDAQRAQDAIAGADPTTRRNMFVQENSGSYQQNYQQARGFYK